MVSLLWLCVAARKNVRRQSGDMFARYPSHSFDGREETIIRFVYNFLYLYLYLFLCLCASILLSTSQTLPVCSYVSLCFSVSVVVFLHFSPFLCLCLCLMGSYIFSTSLGLLCVPIFPSFSQSLSMCSYISLYLYVCVFLYFLYLPAPDCVFLYFPLFLCLCVFLYFSTSLRLNVCSYIYLYLSVSVCVSRYLSLPLCLCL